MLNEKDYCDYETCVALRELGYYDPIQSNTHLTILLYDAQKWLREKKGIVVDVTFSPFGYFASIYTNARQVESEHLKACFKFQWDDKVYANSESFTYEEALLEGIKEAIKILKEE